MVIHEAHKTINALKQALPNSFVFVLDTTDRSFIFKSIDHLECEQAILEIDRNQGIDILSRDKGFYLDQREAGMIGIRNISTNTYVGFCLPQIHKNGVDTTLAESIIRNEKVVY